MLFMVTVRQTKLIMMILLNTIINLSLTDNQLSKRLLISIRQINPSRKYCSMS